MKHVNGEELTFFVGMKGVIRKKKTRFNKFTKLPNPRMSQKSPSSSPVNNNNSHQITASEHESNQILREILTKRTDQSMKHNRGLES